MEREDKTATVWRWDPQASEFRDYRFRAKLTKANWERVTHFFEHYGLRSLYNTDNPRRIVLCGESAGKCRFCGRKSPSATFKQKAHVIPESMGNRLLLSSFECDECNALFGKFDDALTRFIGPLRTISGMSGHTDKAAPKHKDPKTGFEIKDVGGRLEIRYQDDNDVIIDMKDQSFTLSMRKQSYIPLHAYKALTKIGLSLLPEQLMTDYELAMKFLTSSEKAGSLDGFTFAKAIVHFFAGDLRRGVTVFMYEKLPQFGSMELPTHCLVVYYSNHVLQTFLPFNKRDEWMFRKSRRVRFLIVPCFMHGTRLDDDERHVVHDLSSCVLRCEEQQKVQIATDKMTIEHGLDE